MGTVKGRIAISKPTLKGRSTRGYLGGSALNFRNATSSPKIALTLRRVPLNTFELPCSAVEIVLYVAQPDESDSSRTTPGTIDTELANFIPCSPWRRPDAPFLLIVTRELFLGFFHGRRFDGLVVGPAALVNALRRAGRGRCRYECEE